MDNGAVRDRGPAKGRYVLAPLATVIVLVLTLILVLLFLRGQLNSPCGFSCGVTSSVSRAPRS